MKMANDDEQDDYLFEVVEIKQEINPEEESPKSSQNTQDIAPLRPTFDKVDDILVTYAEDIPLCWTTSQSNNFKHVNQWLLVKNRKLGCRYCMNIQDWQNFENAPEKGIRPSATTIAWRTCQISYGGRTMETNQSSLRKKIFEHKHSKAHIYATQIEESNDQNSTNELLTQLKFQLDVETTKQIFETVYAIVKQKQSIERFTSAFSFQDFGTLTSEKLFVDILHHMVFELRKIIVTDLLANGKQITIQVHENGTVNKKTYLALHIKIHDEDDAELGDVLFFDLIESSSSTPDEALVSVLNCLQKNNITMNYLKRNLIGFVFEEQSILVGKSAHVGSAMQKLFPKAMLSYDSTYTFKKISLNLYHEIKTKNGKSQLKTSVVADIMFVIFVGPHTHQFNAADFIQSWLNIQNTESSDQSGTQLITTFTTKKISNDMALAAEAHDEERLVIDLKADTDNEEQTESKYCRDTAESDNSGSVKRRKRSWRQTDKLNDLSEDVIERIVQRVREASDLYAIDEDKDRLFLLSLLPFMKQLNSRENLEFRTEIQQLLQKKQHPNGQCN